ncbi:MAG: hypothetical protein OSB70_07550 [Myxococcota bacterium]|nr:hypothetical protein [Myxococcota bacterium]
MVRILRKRGDASLSLLQRAWVVVVVMGLLLSACQIEEIEPVGSGSAEESSSAGVEREARLAAANRGLEWLLDHADEMPPGWAPFFLLRLHRITSDVETASRIERVLRDDSAPSRRFPLPDYLGHPKLLRSPGLMSVLFELRRRKAVGEPYEAQAEVVRKLFESRGKKFWPRVHFTQRIVYLHQFRELGWRTPFEFEELVGQVEMSAKSRQWRGGTQDQPTLYAITHLILVEGRYFREYVDPEPYKAMIPFLLLSLKRLTSEGLGGERELDISAEILATLALIQYPDSDLTRQARRQLVAAQNPDGSWGDGEGVTAGRVHATLVAVWATMVLPSEFRPDPDLAIRP